MESNHLYTSRQNRTYQMPPELNDVRDENFPLYILVALWALRIDHPVTVSMVRVAFGISIRRASDILEYIMERGSSIIDAECTLHYLDQGDKRLRRTWVIKGVCDGLSRFCQKPVDRKGGHPPENKEKADRTGELRKWFIRRAAGKPVPDELL